MARPRFGGGGRGRRDRRKTTWVAPADQDVVSVSTGGASLVASFDASANAMLAPTIVRTRGIVSIFPQTFGADVQIGGAFGVCVVSDQAFAAGVASVPDPWDEAFWGGWYVWQPFSFRMEFSDTTGLLLPANVSFEVDSKAMRKITEDETIVMIAASQTGAFNISMHLRTLLMLS